MSKLKKLQKILGRKEPEPDATPEEIKQLELNLKREHLKYGIAKTKEAMPKSGIAKVFNKILEKKSSSPTTARAKAKKQDDYEKKLRRGFGI